MTFVDQLQPTAMSFLVKHLHHLAVLEPFDLSRRSHHCIASPCCTSCVGSICATVHRRGRGGRSLLVPSNFDEMIPGNVRFWEGQNDLVHVTCWQRMHGSLMASVSRRDLSRANGRSRLAKTNNEVMTDPSERTVHGRRYISMDGFTKQLIIWGVPPCS